MKKGCLWLSFSAVLLLFGCTKSGDDPEPTAKYVKFEDATFEAYCLANFDADGDGKISLEEAETVSVINISSLKIRSLSGIEHFTEIKELYCQHCQLTELNLRNHKNLEKIDASNNPWKTVNLSDCDNLTRADFFGFSDIEYPVFESLDVKIALRLYI